MEMNGAGENEILVIIEDDVIQEIKGNGESRVIVRRYDSDGFDVDDFEIKDDERGRQYCQTVWEPEPGDGSGITWKETSNGMMGLDFAGRIWAREENGALIVKENECIGHSDSGDWREALANMYRNQLARIKYHLQKMDASGILDDYVEGKMDDSPAGRLAGESFRVIMGIVGLY